MKIINQRKILILILLLPLLLLSGCEDADLDLLEIAFEAWAEEEHLLVDGKWKPDEVVQKAVENTIADITNQEESIQLDGVNVVRESDNADALAGAAIEEQNPAKMNEALEMRPKDWRIHEQNAVLQTLEGDSHKSLDSIEESNDLLLERAKQSGNCTATHLEQLEYRRDAYEINLEKCNNTPSCDSLMFETMIDSTSDAIWNIVDLGYSEGCGNLP